jgi:HK97 family phage prohead protease
MALIEALLRAAISVHHTDTSDGAWDGPSAVKNLRLDADEKYYSLAFAWRDAEADQAKKSSYKFIHHDVASDGEIGAANISACRTGIGVLNGARGGTTIPRSDRQGVYDHLAAHLKDAKLDVPELKSHVGEREVRAFGTSEIRVSQDAKKIEGHAALFNTKSQPIFGFRERIQPGAFAKTIQESDIRALFNHDPNIVLGRNKSGTLELSEDSKGLYMRITPPDTQAARDVIEMVRRGDVSQCSFGFRCMKDSWSIDDGESLRDIHEARLFDVSPVTYPAYTETECQVRSDVQQALLKLQGGHALSESETDLLRAHDREIEARMGDRTDLPENSVSSTKPEQKKELHSLDLLRRRETLAELE